jgi:proteasome lid subunit RPN8/RPN11
MIESQTYQAPDVRDLRDRPLPEAPFPGHRGDGLRIYLTPEAYQTVHAHAAEDTSVEICGVLVGTWARDPGGAYIEVTDVIRGEAARNKFAEVRFTHDTWARINEQMDKRFADRAIVGWYHTHPDFGIFLSDRDRFIHEHFFSGAGQIALVVDPVRRTEGAFAWRDGKPALCSHFWVGDRVVAAIAADSESAAASGAERATAAAQAAAGKGEPSRGPWVTQTLAYVALFLLGVVVATYRSAWEQTRLVEGVVAHFGVWRALRPGLHEALNALGTELARVRNDVDRLSAEAVKSRSDGKDGDDQRQQWTTLRRDLTDAGRLVGELDRTYSLSVEENAALEKFLLESLRSMEAPRSAEGPSRPPPANAKAPATAPPSPAAPVPTEPSK